MSRHRSYQKMKGTWAREARALVAFINPFYNASILVALVVTIVTEIGQNDGWFWAPIILIISQSCLLTMMWLIGEIAITLIEIAEFWCIRFATRNQNRSRTLFAGQRPAEAPAPSTRILYRIPYSP